MHSENDEADYLSRDGEPSHYVLLRTVWRHWLTACASLFCEVRRMDTSEVGTVILNRAHARMMTLEVVLSELLDVCSENDWPIPRQIKIDRELPIEEGQ